MVEKGALLGREVTGKGNHRLQRAGVIGRTSPRLIPQSCFNSKPHPYLVKSDGTALIQIPQPYLTV